MESAIAPTSTLVSRVSSFGTLQQLAKVENRSKPKTPEQPHAMPRTARRTPAVGGRLNPKSPHALRAFEQQRRLSIGRERRRSMVAKARVSDIDVLRNLSRALAPSSRVPVLNTPVATGTPRLLLSSRRARRSSTIVTYPEKPVGEIYEDDDDMPPPPRLSLNYNDYWDVSDEDLPVPLTSLLSAGDDDRDVHSSCRDSSPGIEAGRRAHRRVSEYGIPDLLEADVEEDHDPFAHLNRSTRRGFGFDFDDTQLSLRDSDSRLSILPNDDEGSYSAVKMEDSRMLLPYADSMDDFQMATPGVDLTVTNQRGSPSSSPDITDQRWTGFSECKGSRTFDRIDSPLFSDKSPLLDAQGDLSPQLPDEEELLEDTDVDEYQNLAAFGPGGFEIRIQEVDEDDGMAANTLAVDSNLISNMPQNKKAKKRSMHMSAIGVEYPPFPKRVIKKLAEQYSGGKISNETLKALEAATDAFFKKVSGGLGTYATHAGRKTIEDGDALLQLKTSRRVSHRSSIFSLAHRHLPRELTQHVRMPVLPKGRRPRAIKK